MVEFLSLLIGLFTGSHTVQLDVVGEVVAVEVRLDGAALATLTRPPWELEVDFGPTPQPHQLLAIARDGDGEEVGRATRWVNLADSSAAAAMTLDPGGDGRPAAVLLSWQSIGVRRPSAVELSFDGEPLAVTDPRRTPLPPYDPKQIHFVSAVVRFSDERVSRLEASFGGELGEEVRTELTAVAVHLEKGARLPPPEKLQSWFLKDGAPLAVHGVEKGPAEVILVRDPTAQPYLERLGELALDVVGGVARTGPESTQVEQIRRRTRMNQRDQDLRYLAWLGDDVHLRFLAPGAAPILGEGLTPWLFLHSPSYGAAEGGLLRVSQRLPRMEFPLRLADAVATAGMAAHGTHRRRAVVLLLADAAGDRSSYSSAAATDYLRQLHVPLAVWSFAADGEHSDWSQARYVGPEPRDRKLPGRFRDALGELKRELRRQRIVWLEGHHLPQAIELSPAARGVRLAGR